MSADLDVIVIGAGAAGLAALSELQAAGKQALCLEARGRIGGRIFTVHDPLSPVPLELGAEFIHGRPPEIWDIVRSHTLKAYDCAENSLHLRDGKIEDRSDAWLLLDHILDLMKQAAASGPDRSFDEFLSAVSASEEAKLWARSYVQGFNAAHAGTISIQALAKESEASEAIDGDRSFRILDGYDSIPIALARNRSAIRLNTIVEQVAWANRSVTVQTCSAITGEVSSVQARSVLITVPLGTLQTNGIRLDPEPTSNLIAARQLCFGQVVRLVLRFRTPVWAASPDFADAGFLLSQGAVFPTWWSSLPIRAPILVGWSAGPKADALAACERNEVIARALGQLAEMTALSVGRLGAELEQVYYHDWATDPFSRGAYSYVAAGAADARERLAAPVQETLYFAGEATDLEGHAATVHGAIASGRRAARQILSI